MDATTLLRKDHEAVRQLFRDFTAAGNDADARRSLYRHIRHELQTQSRVEEHVFYPAVMRLRAEPAREAVRDALEDHHIVDGLLAELDQLEPEDVQYGEKMRTLQQSVERHIASEEEALFTQARIHLTDERLERLGRDMESLRESLVGDTPASPDASRAPARA